MPAKLHPWRRNPVIQGTLLFMSVIAGAFVGTISRELFNVGTIVMLPVAWVVASLFLGILFEQWALRLAIAFNFASVAAILIQGTIEQGEQFWNDLSLLVGIVVFMFVPAIIVAYASLIPRLFRVYPMEDADEEPDSDKRWENGEHMSSPTEDN